MARVLVVDDELGYRVSLEFFLNQAGHEVIAVGTTAAASSRPWTSNRKWSSWIGCWETSKPAPTWRPP